MLQKGQLIFERQFWYLGHIESTNYSPKILYFTVWLYVLHQKCKQQRQIILHN